MIFVFSGLCSWSSWTRSSSCLIFSSRSFFPRDIANFSDLWMDIAVTAASSSSIVWLLSSLVLFDVTACLFLYWYSVSDDFLFLLTVWPGSVDGIWTALLLSLLGECWRHSVVAASLTLVVLLSWPLVIWLYNFSSVGCLSSVFANLLHGY